MMEKRKNKIRNNFLLMNIFVTWCVFSCSTGEPLQPEDNGLLLKLKTAIHQSRLTNSNSVDLAAITPFHWEKLTILTPYTEEEKISTLLGFDWPQSKHLGIERTESYNVLVFSRKDTVVSWFRFYRSNGDFANIKEHTYYRNSAVFKIRIDSTNSPPWVYLEK